HITMVAGGGGSYTASLDHLEPGRYRVSATAMRAGRLLGRSTSEFAVDRWSLEEARAVPDCAALAPLSRASGGRSGTAGPQAPWVFAVVVGALSVEWWWRRRRGLP